MNVPSISVIIPHRDDLRGLDRCLRALETQQPTDASVEIIVADNLSVAGADAVRACIAGRARIVEAAQPGAGPARNCAVAASRAPVLAFIDSDCVADPGWLARGRAALGRWDVVGGRVDVFVEHDGPLSAAEAFERVFAFDNAAYVRDKGFSVTANLWCRRAVFDATGPFGVGLSEDLDWSHRATAAGYTLGYADDVVVGHPARADWPQLRRKWARIGRETYALRPATAAHRLRWLIRAWAMPLSILAHMPRALRSTRLHHPADRRRAIAGLARLRLWRMVDAHRILFERHG